MGTNTKLNFNNIKLRFSKLKKKEKLKGMNGLELSEGFGLHLIHPDVAVDAYKKNEKVNYNEKNMTIVSELLKNFGLLLELPYVNGLTKKMFYITSEKYFLETENVFLKRGKVF